MGKLVRQFWRAEVGGLGISRKDRAGGAYDAYVPDAVARREFMLEGIVAADVADATTAITRLDLAAATLTSTEALARIFLRAESVASSNIEGLRVSPQRLLRADIARAEGTPINDDTATEVLANVDAMAYAVNEVSGPITVEQILEVHRRLLSPTNTAIYAGVVRNEQNWIGGSDFNPMNAAFVPPPAAEVPALFDDLVAFCNEDRLPAVAQAAIAHAQFETIHPFVDGNGRTGRALIHMILRRRGLAKRTTPPISLALATRAKEYVVGLGATRYVGDATSLPAITGLNTWIGFFAAVCTRAVADAELFEQRVRELQVEWEHRLSHLRSDSSVFALVRCLPEMPVFTIRGAAERLGRTFAAVNGAVAILVSAGILTPVKAGQRNRVFEARELIDAFTALERQLASPHGNTRTSAPARPVPDRAKRPRDAEQRER